MRRWIVQGLLPALAPVLVLVGVIAWGQYSRDRLRTQDRYRLPFATIDCPSPPSLSRDDFLNEVQYQSSLPDRVDLLDGDTPERLRQAFARHPWVERVDRVEICWPSGRHSTLTEPALGRSHRVVEPDAAPGSTPNIVGLEQWALKRRQRGKKA